MTRARRSRYGRHAASDPLSLVRLLLTLVLGTAPCTALAASSRSPLPTGSWLPFIGLGLAVLAAGIWWAYQKRPRSPGFADYLQSDPPARGYLGVTRSGAALRPGENRRCQHVLVVADRMDEAAHLYTQPNLLLDAYDGVSVVMFDVCADGPGTQLPPGGHLSRMLPLFTPGHDVQVFAPFGSSTLRYPLLDGLETPEAAAAFSGALLGQTADLASGAADSDAGGVGATERRASHGLLEGLLLDLQQRPSAGLRDLHAVVQGGPDALSAHLAHAERSARQRTHLYFSLRQEQQVAVAAHLARTLAVFADPALDAATRSQQVDGPGETLDVASALTRPVAVYLRVPFALAQTPGGAALLRLLQHVVFQDLRRAGAQAGGAPAQHVAVYLPPAFAGSQASDPATSTQVPGLPETLAALRMTRVACTAFMPTLGTNPAAPSLYGHVLVLGAAGQAELSLADGRRTPVWLSALDERRAGPVQNPLYEGAKQALSDPPDTDDDADLLRDLVLQRRLRSRARQVSSHLGTGSPNLDQLILWTETLLATGSAWQRDGDGPGPVTPQTLPTPAQGTRWKELGWLVQGRPEASPALTELGWNLLGEDRRRWIETLCATELPTTLPDDPGPLEFENPVETRQTRLLSLLAEHRDLTPAQIVAMTDLPETTVRRDLGVLEEQGLVQSARVAGKRRYKLVPAAQQRALPEVQQLADPASPDE